MIRPQTKKENVGKSSRTRGDIFWRGFGAKLGFIFKFFYSDMEMVLCWKGVFPPAPAAGGVLTPKISPVIWRLNGQV